MLQARNEQTQEKITLNGLSPSFCEIPNEHFQFLIKMAFTNLVLRHVSASYVPNVSGSLSRTACALNKFSKRHNRFTHLSCAPLLAYLITEAMYCKATNQSGGTEYSKSCKQNIFRT